VGKLSLAPEISVIMSVYNGEAYLSEAIESVINQTFTDWELIIINDCSKDSTGEILSEYMLKDERIKVFTNEVNLKLPSSLNKAISYSSGKYIARMDSDDICLPERLERQFKFMEENKDVDLSSCRFLTLKNGIYSSGGCGGRCDSEALKAMLLFTNPILHPGVIAKAEVMKVLNYDTSLTCTEDLELWTRMFKQNLKLQILPEYLLIYRLHDKQITSTTLEKQCAEVIKIQDEYYDSFLKIMDSETKKFYINGVYFKGKADINKFCNFAKWVKKVNKSKKAFKTVFLDYALFEVFAEYKRCGLAKTDVIRGMFNFNLVFLIKEVLRRKKCAALDGEACLKAAEKYGLIRVSGTNLFPIFSGDSDRS